MKKNNLLKYGSSIIRILEVKDSSALVVDCVHKAMPKWMPLSEFDGYESCSENELLSATGKIKYDYDSLSQEDKRFVHEHFTLIAGILPFVSDEKQRCAMTSSIAKTNGVSKQTIRNYLWLFLVYQDIAALAPKQTQVNRPLTQDEQNIRWALNKFFYTRHKNSLNTAYTLMLKEKYCNTNGELFSDYPSIHQFRYFYHKYNKMQTYYISREGLKAYQRNYRPLLGDGVQQFAPAVGIGMLDSTICDIYLVNDGGKLVGRPILTTCVDAFSGLCCGYSLGWEGGTYSLRGLMLNVITNKQDWCESHGVFIDDGEWDTQHMPGVLVTDMGSEYKGDTFSQIVELGVNVVNLPPYRPELKGVVEKFFDAVQNSYRKHLKGKGVIEPDYQERGTHDYRKDACLTLREFEQVILHCIVYYNNCRVVDFPFTEEMLADGVKPYASSIFSWGKEQMGANLISVTPQRLIQTLLPRAPGAFTRKGLRVNGLRYKHENYTEAFLSGGKVTVAYNPEDITEVWLLNDGQYVPFTLIESRFSGKSLAAVQTMQKAKKQTVNAATAENLQAQIDLAEHIQVIATKSKQTDVCIKNIRETRKKEQTRTHIDFLKEAEQHG